MRNEPGKVLAMGKNMWNSSFLPFYGLCRTREIRAFERMEENFVRVRDRCSMYWVLDDGTSNSLNGRFWDFINILTN